VDFETIFFGRPFRQYGTFQFGLHKRIDGRAIVGMKIKPELATNHD